MTEISKLIYSLSACRTINSLLTKHMLKPYESKKLIATRHFFRIYIKLTEDDTDKFLIKNVSYDFGDDTNPIVNSTIDKFNSNILDKDAESIHKQLISKNILLNSDDIISIYTIAASIKLFSKEYKYIYFPIIIDYGRNLSYSHQTALLIDVSGIILFYEPHGMYKKFSKSYAECICDLLTIFKDVMNTPSTLRISTYHNFLQMDRGIQNIIMIKNNNNSTQFDDEFTHIIDDLKKTYPTEFEDNYKVASIIKTKDSLDKTFQIIALMSYFMKINIRAFTADETKILESFGNKLFDIYIKYTSQTCVTITLIEINKFLSLCESNSIADVDAKYKNISSELKKMHAEFDVPNPNSILGRYLSSLLEVLQKKDILMDILKTLDYPYNLCNTINK